MIVDQICPTCGTPLVENAIGGLCRKCLGRLGFFSGDGEEEEEQATNPGPRQFGDYALVEEIARGGMGVVYKARQLSLDRIVALKMVLHGPFSSEEFIRRFRMEAQAAASLHHPNIVPIYEVGHHDGQHYFSMEYIDGQSLSEAVRERPLPARRAARYLKAMAEAMHHAHQQGVLHRDLKPSNVLLDSLDQPRITDFGLAKLIHSDSQLTVTGQALGSPSHMPPEQAAGKHGPASPAGDIYSLGAILYHLLTGRPPFQGETLQEILLQVQSAEPVPPSRLNPSVPADLQTICLKCLEKEPSRRYASAESLAEDVTRFLKDEPIRARPTSAAQRAWLWCRRHPAPAVLSAALGLAVLLGLVGILWEWQRARFSAAGELNQRRLAEAYAEKTRLNLYAADVNLASQAISRGDLGLARRTLANLRPALGETDLRGFEWRYLWNLCRGDQLATLTGHTWIVTCLAFSPDGRLLATGSQDGSAKIWDTQQFKLLVSLPTPGTVWSTGFTPDGQLLMTATHGGVYFWSVGTWQRVMNYPGQIGALSKTGSLLAVSASSPFYFESAGPVSLWDYRTGRKLLDLDQPGRALAFSPDGRKLAIAGTESGVFLCETAKGKLLRTFATGRPVWSLAFSPDGERLLAAGWSSEPLVWDLTSERPPVKLQGHSLTVWSATFSPDGSAILTAASDQTLRCWDARTFRPTAVFHGHDNEAWCAAYRPDGRMLASGGKDQTVRLWPAELPQPPDSLPHENDTRFLFSPDGSRMVLWKKSGNGQAGRIAEEPVKLTNATGTQSREQEAPDPGWRPSLWDLDHRITVGPMPAGLAIGFSPDGARVEYLNAAAGTIEAWSPAGGPPESVKLAEAQCDDNGFDRVGFSPDWTRMYAIDTDGLIRFWDAATGKLLASIRGPGPPIRTAVLGPGGKQFAVSLERENAVHLFETATGREMRLAGHRDFVSGLAFSPDGKILATGGMDAAIDLWDTATGKELGACSGHMEEVTDLAFSPDGRTLASLAHRDSIKLWHVATRRELVSLSLPQAGLYVRFSPDGHRLAVATEAASVRLLDAPEAGAMKAE